MGFSSPESIGLRDKLQENPIIFMGKAMVSSFFDFDIKVVNPLTENRKKSWCPTLPSGENDERHGRQSQRQEAVGEDLPPNVQRLSDGCPMSTRFGA